MTGNVQIEAKVPWIPESESFDLSRVQAPQPASRARPPVTLRLAAPADGLRSSFCRLVLRELLFQRCC